MNKNTPNKIIKILYKNYHPINYVVLCHSSSVRFELMLKICIDLKKMGFLTYTVPFLGASIVRQDGTVIRYPASEGDLCARLTMDGFQHAEQKHKEQKHRQRSLLIALIGLILTVLLILAVLLVQSS